MAKYTPKKGDFIFVSFDPSKGHEQKGYRPALVVSNDLFNLKTALVIVCPVTNTDRNFPFHLEISGGIKVKGFVMVDQVRTFDFASRKVKFIEKSPFGLIYDVLELLEEIVE